MFHLPGFEPPARDRFARDRRPDPYPGDPGRSRASGCDSASSVRSAARCHNANRSHRARARIRKNCRNDRKRARRAAFHGGRDATHDRLRQRSLRAHCRLFSRRRFWLLAVQALHSAAAPWSVVAPWRKHWKSPAARATAHPASAWIAALLQPYWAAPPGLFLSARFWQPAAGLLLQPAAGWRPATAMAPAARAALPPKSAAIIARDFAASRFAAERFAGFAPAAAPTFRRTDPE